MFTLIKKLPYVIATVALVSGQAYAEEGGSGHYSPGSMASFVDGVPAAGAFITRLNVINYNGSSNLNLPIAGSIDKNVKASVQGYGLTLAWNPAWIDPKSKWSYAMSTTIPLLQATVSADVALGNLSVKKKQSITDLGDIVIQPFIIGYNVNPNFNINFRTSLYAPTGKYTKGALANTGKNFWSVEPAFGMAYFNKKNGIEATMYTGLTYNGTNDITHYKSGQQLHLDGVLAQHFPVGKGLLGVGAAAYFYQQITGDSGSGATLGSFKGETTGAGPVVSYVGKVNEHPISMELKWLHEFNTTNRLSGDTVFLKALLQF